jgi:CheY-like chemotaxis protein
VRKEQDLGDRERLRFTVTDTGVGVEGHQQQHLFEPFAQADASITRRFGGTGLGLSISKRLVELMGGEIGFQSQPGAGSSFWFSVALPRAQAPALLAEPRPRPGTAGARILLVEDLPMNQELAKAMIARAGHDVDVASDGEEALKAVRARDYDLILMDIQMPRMDGITATRIIRQLPPPKSRVPIVAMTANVLPEQVKEFLAAGMDNHVAKPVRQAELHAAIAAALPVRRVARGLADETAGEAVEEAAAVTAFDEATFKEVAEMLPPGRLRGHVDTLEQAVAALAGGADDSQALAAAAHKVVSQAGMLGLPRLSAAARTLEEAARAGAPLQAPMASFRARSGDVGEHLRPRLA